MSTPFRAPRTIVEMLQMQIRAAALRAAGRAESADAVEAAIRSVSFDPESVRILEALRGFNPPVTLDAGVSLRGLANQDIPAPSATSFEDMAQDIDQSVRNYNWMRSNRAGGMKNQWRGDIGGRAIRDAAQEGIARAAAAEQSEAMARAAAGMGAAGLGALIAGTGGRMQGGGRGVEPPVTADAPPPAAPESDPFMDYVGQDAELLPVEDPPIPEERFPPVALSDAELGLTDFSPMDTADLVAESRPIPESTPRVQPETLTPEEIAALRGQVIAISDANTGQAMDSFYPPESEEYKREQRMKLRYPKLRR